MTDPAWISTLQLLTPVFDAHCTRRNLPGCAFGLVTKAGLVAKGSSGVVNPSTQGAPDARTVYRIASMTKSFGALAILMLRDAGALRLDAPAADYVPELARLAYPTRDSGPLTVRHLLTMSAGWPEDNAWGDRQLERDNGWLGELLASGVAFANAPGVTYEYSNLGYMVLGRIIANVSGEGSMDFINRRILQPLGMHDTVWNREDVDPARLARGYRWLDGAWVEEPMLPSGGDGAVFGALYSTVADVARWVALMLSAWPPRDDPDDAIAPRATLRELQGPWRMYRPALEPPRLGEPVVWSAGGYGLGLRTNYDGPVVSVHHSGGLPGFGSHMGWLPDHNLGLVALANVRDAEMGGVTADALLRLAQGGRLRARTVQPSMALVRAQAVVNQLVGGWDEALADELFADNFYLDDSRERRQGEIAALVARHGELHNGGPLEPQNALRGGWKLTGAAGWVNVFLTLTPTVPSRIQELTFESVLPPGAELQARLDDLLKLINRPSQHQADKLFAEAPAWDAAQDTLYPASPHSLYDKVRLAAVLCGACRWGRVLAGDGERWVRLLIEGEKGVVEAELTLDADGRKFVRADFRHVSLRA
jgi:CubicO group peptidase (beta-lactamase class C family)